MTKDEALQVAIRQWRFYMEEHERDDARNINTPESQLFFECKSAADADEAKPEQSHNSAMLKLPTFRDIYNRVPSEEHRGYAISFYCELCSQLQQ
jgi:hypothetical protein